MFSLGFQGALYYLTATHTRASWGTTGAGGITTGTLPANLTLIPNVIDVTLPLDGNKVKLTTRAGGGFAASAPGIIDGDFTISQVYDPTDPLYLAMVAALLNRSVQALAILDHLASTVGATGIYADFCCTKIEKTEPVEDKQMVTYSVAFGYSAVPPQVVQVSGS
jgi:hypothetical protein